MDRLAQIKQDLLKVLSRPFEEITLQQLALHSATLIAAVLAALITYRVFQWMDNVLQRRGRPSRAKLFQLLRIPASFSAFLFGLLILGLLMGWETLAPTVLNYIRFLLWISIAWGVIRSLEYIIVVRLLYERHGVRMPRLFHDLILWAFYLIAFLFLLKTYFPDADLTVLLTTSALLSVILGLALQDTLANLFAGLALHFEGSLHLGQWIGVGEWEGEIAGITWRAIKMRTFEGDYVIIPNSLISKGELTNYSQPTTMHVQRLPIGVSYECPPDHLKRVCLEVLDKVEGVLRSPVRTVMLQQYADFSVNYEMRFWIRDYSQYRRIRDEVYSLLWYHFKREGIVIPFPIRTLDIPGRAGRRREVEQKEELDELRRVDFLAGLENETLRMIQQHIRPLIFGSGEVIIEQDKPSDKFYVIRSGEVEVSARDALGKERRIITLGAGAYFGEHSVFAGEPANATITALIETRVLGLDQSIFEKVLHSNPNAADRISKTISERAAGRTQVLEQGDEVVAAKPPASREEVQAYANWFLRKMRRLFNL